MENSPFQNLLNLGDFDQKYEPTKEQKNCAEKCYKGLISKLTASAEKVYGIHTGYGSNVTSNRDPKDWMNAQQDLLAYLLVGVGEHLSETVVRRALRLQLDKAYLGFSGIHPETLEHLTSISNGKVLPSVPCFGSLGASGDLIPMAHAISPLFSEHSPRGPRDVIGLVNTNSMMVSYAAELLQIVRAQWQLAHHITALIMAAVNAPLDPITEDVVLLRPEGDHYRDSARLIRAELQSIDTRPESNRPFSSVQARYSIRCAPMILGNTLDLLNLAEKKILSDAHSVADNPVLVEKNDRLHVAHAGLFYAAATATAADLMSDALGKICELLDRQVLILMDPLLSEGLPENLAVAGASHCKGLHQLTSALLQQLRTHSVPSRMLSFSCEGNNQDVVPCAMAALNQLKSACTVASELTKASLFVALRAYSIRTNTALPSELHIARWSEFQPKNAKLILSSLKFKN
ncbi:MAG: aromatic amino acid lyase [Bdellovibrio sp.]|nr:aromatic amino acid lyase [Bdellovibrio sp.]